MSVELIDNLLRITLDSQTQELSLQSPNLQKYKKKLII